MQEQELDRIEKIIGYRFRNRALLRQAFTRSSYVNEMAQAHTPSDTQSNEVLEFLGDSILSAALAYLLVERNSSIGRHGLQTPLNEEDYSIIKSNMSDKRALAAAVRRLGLGAFMRLSRGDINQDVLQQDSPNEDLFESIVAAVAIDCHMDLTTILDLVRRLDDADRLLDRGATAARKNGKTRLKEYCERRRTAYHYTITHTEGPEHAKTFFCRLDVTGFPPFAGEGPSRAKAETDAADRAVAYLTERGENV